MSSYRDGFIVAAEALQYLAGKIRQVKDDEDINNNSNARQTAAGKDFIKDQLEQEAQRIENVAKEFHDRIRQSSEDPERERAWMQDSSFGDTYRVITCQALTVYSQDLDETRKKIFEKLRMNKNNIDSSILSNDAHSFKVEYLEHLLREVENYKEAFCRPVANNP